MLTSHRKNPIYLKQIDTSQSNQMKFENLKSSLPLKRFILRFLTPLNIRKPKVREKRISRISNSYFYNCKPSPHILHQHRVLRNLIKKEDILITKPDKGNGVVILDRKLYNSAIQEIISDTSKFEKLNKDPNLKREA